MKVFEAIKIGSNLLKEKKITSHVIDSEILLSKILDKSREEVLINPDKKIFYYLTNSYLGGLNMNQ